MKKHKLDLENKKYSEKTLEKNIKLFDLYTVGMMKLIINIFFLR